MFFSCSVRQFDDNFNPPLCNYVCVAGGVGLLVRVAVLLRAGEQLPGPAGAETG